MRKLLILSLSTMSLLSSCEKPVERVSPKLNKELGNPVINNTLNSSNPNRDPARIATNPDGGLIVGKSPVVSTEEDLRRIAVNAALPLSFGDGVSGITMNTSREASKAILSNPKFSTASGIDVFGEGIQVTWAEGINPLPKSIRIVEGYKGSVTLPAPYGKLALGQDLGGLLASEADKLSFTRALGAAAAGKDETYDCIAAEACQLEDRAGTLFIDYPNGTVIVIENKIYLMEYLSNSGFVPKNVAPIVFDTSMAGISFTQTKADVVAAYGEAYRYASATKELYDAKTLRFVFSPEGAIAQMEATKGFKGTIKIADKDYGIGSSLKELAPMDDVDGKKMMLLLAQKILGKDETYDCSKEMPATCASGHSPQDKWIKILVGNTIFQMTDDESRTLVSILMFNPA